MAIQKSKTLSNGAVGNYWRIISITTNRMTMEVEWVMALFKDKETSQAGAAPLGALKKFVFKCTREQVGSDLTQLGYEKIRAKCEAMVTRNLRGELLDTPVRFDDDIANGTDV